MQLATAHVTMDLWSHIPAAAQDVTDFISAIGLLRGAEVESHLLTRRQGVTRDPQLLRWSLRLACCLL